MIIRVHTGKLGFASHRLVLHSFLMRFVILALSSIGMLGCGATSGKVITPTISLALTQLPPASLLVGGTATLSATVSDDIASAGVDWVAVCVSIKMRSCGSFSPAHTDSGAATTFTAPADVPKNNTVAITALSATDHSKSFAANVAVTSNVSGVLITMPPPLVMPAGGNIVLSATVAGDPVGIGLGGVDWSVTCANVANLVCGSFNNGNTADGGLTTFTATSALTDPTIVGATLTITAASITDHNIIATATVMVAASISITITERPPSSMLINAMASLIATISNDLANAGVDWTVSCNNQPCGSFSPSNSPTAHTFSGAPITFIAPNAVPPGGTVTITAASTTDPNTLTRIDVTITAPISVKITQGVTNNTLVVNAMAQLIATVSNDAASAGVDWSVTCSSADCGSFSRTHSAVDASGAAATTYTAPQTVPAGSTVTIAATSTSDKTKSASTPAITITANIPPNSLLKGQFVFLLTGKDQNLGFYSFAGTIVGNGNGTITGGEFDVADASGNGGTSQSVSGTYSIGTDGRGQILLTLPSTFTFGVSANSGASGQVTLSVSFVTPKHALLSETDTFGSGTGTLDLQNTADESAFTSGTSGLNGTYSLALSGAEAISPTVRFFLASALATSLDTTTSPPTVTETGAVGDQSDNGTVTTDVAATTVPVTLGGTQPDGFGRLLDQGAIDLGARQLNLAAYMIDASHFVITDFRDSGSLIIGGYMVAQPASLVISGTYAFTETGATASPSPQPQVAGGIFTCGSGGTLDVTPLVGTSTANQAISSACTGPTNGRALITISGAGTTGIGKFAAYPTLDMGLQLVEIDTAGPFGAGVALQQTVHTPVPASVFSGKYASNFLASTAQGIEGFAGQVDSDGASILLSSLADINSFNTTSNVGTPSSNVSLSGSYIAPPNSNGRFPLTLNFATLTPQTIKPACYVVDSNTCLLLGLESTTPGVGILQLQNLGL
jgi:hypothetical protein